VNSERGDSEDRGVNECLLGDGRRQVSRAGATGGRLPASVAESKDAPELLLDVRQAASHRKSASFGGAVAVELVFQGPRGLSDRRTRIPNAPKPLPGGGRGSAEIVHLKVSAIAQLSAKPV